MHRWLFEYEGDGRHTVGTAHMIVYADSDDEAWRKMKEKQRLSADRYGAVSPEGGDIRSPRLLGRVV